MDVSLIEGSSLSGYCTAMDYFRESMKEWEKLPLAGLENFLGSLYFLIMGILVFICPISES